LCIYLFQQKKWNDWVTFWAIFSQTHLLTLAEEETTGQQSKPERKKQLMQ
jgi:hypothetical protein